MAKIFRHVNKKEINYVLYIVLMGIALYLIQEPLTDFLTLKFGKMFSFIVGLVVLIVLLYKYKIGGSKC